MAKRRLFGRARPATTKRNGESRVTRLRRVNIGWPAVVFAVIVAVAGGIFVWRSFADPLQGQTSTISSDFNKDGKTSLADMSRMLSVFGSQDKTVDLNGDGSVDTADLSILLAAYTQPPRPTATAPQPEVAPPAPAPTPTPGPVAQPAPTPTPPADTTPKPAQEIASEAECPNQSDPALPISLQVAAMQCLTAMARRYHDMTPTKEHATLDKSAAAKAADVANCGFTHDACGHEPQYYFLVYKYDGKCWAENLARGQKSVREAFIALMNSPSHREAILDPGHTDLGVAQLPSDKGMVWVQHFGGCR